MTSNQHPAWKSGWKDAVSTAPRRKYKRARWQEFYNAGRRVGRAMLLHGYAQKIGDAYANQHD